MFCTHLGHTEESYLIGSEWTVLLEQSTKLAGCFEKITF